MCGGFADEFLRTIEARGGVTAPMRYGKTWTRVHDPLVWRETADALLEEAGVRVLFHSTVTEVLSEGERIGGGSAYTKQGRGGEGKITIDASGDADSSAHGGPADLHGRRRPSAEPDNDLPLAGRRRGAFPYGPTARTPSRSRWSSDRSRPARGRRATALPRAKISSSHAAARRAAVQRTRILGRDGRELNPIFVRGHHRGRDRGPPAGARVRASSSATASPAARTPWSTTPACRSACGRRARSRHGTPLQRG